MTDLIANPVVSRLDRACDAIPREDGARVEAVGPFELFLREGPGWPYYARPRLGTLDVTPADVEAVLDRQRALGVPEAIEWVHDVIPSLREAALARGMAVLDAPLMVLDPTLLPAELSAAEPAAPTTSLIDPFSPDFPHLFAVSSAIAMVAFSAGGTAVGEPGPAQRDEALRPTDPDLLALERAALISGRKFQALVTSPTEGVLASGSTQSGDGAVEIVGVATLPSARRRGLATAVSAVLARAALARADVVFLSAASDDVARIYGGIGFRRVGTACIASTSAHP